MSTVPHPPVSQDRPTLAVEIVSLGGAVWAGQARQVELPGTAGRFGVMAGHAPMLATLQEGMAMIRLPDAQALWIYVSGGLVEVQPDKVTVIAELAAPSQTIAQGRLAVAASMDQSPMAGALAGRATGERTV
ncbi:F-type H+-transporting ATPase subunit epsilon [Xanthomonas campestris]